MATAAAASPNPVTGTTCNLSVLGADDAGESNLTYTWSTTGTPPAAVSFSANGSNAAKNTTATFTAAGNYSFQVTITDPGGLTATSSVNVTVNQTLTAIAVSPAFDQSERRRHAAVHGHGRGPVRRGPGPATDVYLGDHRRHDQRGRAVDRAGHAGRQCDGDRQQRRRSAARPRLPPPFSRRRWPRRPPPRPTR